jgi:hypothetical protein
MNLTLNIEELTQAELDRGRKLYAQQEAQAFERRRAARDGEFCKCCGLHHTEGLLHYFARAHYCEAHYPQAR